MPAPLGTAAHHATRDIPIARPAETVDDVLVAMRGRAFTSAEVVAVCEGSRLVGLAPLERLMAADPGTTVADVMDADPAVVPPAALQERAVWKAVHHRGPALAVVGDEGQFLGVVPAERMLAVLLAEHDEDLARLGGFLRSTSAARRAMEEPVSHRLWHRLPWLALGLAGAMLAALVVGAFEDQLERHVILAYFLPAVVYMADAVGTQTEALVIRGLSVGVPIRHVVHRELVTGGLLGAIVAGLFIPFALLVWGDSDVAAAVSVALFAACSIASIIALILPWTFSRLGRDPAFGSGPLATVVQDLLSIVIYFAVAGALVG